MALPPPTRPGFAGVPTQYPPASTALAPPVRAAPEDVLGKLGFNPATAILLVGGLGLKVAALLMDTLLLNNSIDNPRGNETGLLKASLWLGFLGIGLIVGALTGAALTGRKAHWGARLGLLVLAVYAAFQLASLVSVFGSLLRGVGF